MKGDSLYIPNFQTEDEVRLYLWDKYEDEILRKELLDTIPNKLIGKYSNILEEIRNELYNRTIPLPIPDGKFYYFFINVGDTDDMNSITIPPIKFRYKGNVRLHTYDKIEKYNNIVVAKPITFTGSTKLYDISFGKNYIMCFDTVNNEKFIISDVSNLKFSL